MQALLQQSNFFLLDFTQFIFNISWTYLFCTIFILINLILFINTENLIKKITWFFFILFGCLALIWYCALETFGFMLLLTELTLIFFFFIVSTQFILTHLIKPVNILKITMIALLTLLFTELNLLPELNIINSVSYYEATFLITTADYFLMYYFFILYLDIIINVALILGLFSIYFILIYYSLKELQATAVKNKKSIYFLRKQNLFHQSLYQTYLRWFQ